MMGEIPVTLFSLILMLFVFILLIIKSPFKSKTLNKSSKISYSFLLIYALVKVLNAFYKF